MTSSKVESACESDFLVCVSNDNHFVFLRPYRRSNQYSASKKASYQSVIVIEMPFVLICVSVALLYLSIPGERTNERRTKNEQILFRFQSLRLVYIWNYLVTSYLHSKFNAVFNCMLFVYVFRSFVVSLRKVFLYCPRFCFM